MWGKIASQVIVGVLILGIGLFDNPAYGQAFAGDITVLDMDIFGPANDGTVIGPVHSLFTADSAFFTDPTGFALLDDGLAIELLYIGGPGNCTVNITPEFIIADFDQDTECELDFRFCGAFCAPISPPVDLTDGGTNDVTEVEFGKIEFPIALTLEFETAGFTVGQSTISPSITPDPTIVEYSFTLEFVDVGEIDVITFTADGIGNSQFSIGSITVTQAIIVGGTSVPIDTTTLLIAGFNANLIWMIPVIGGIAGLVIFQLKRSR